MTEEIFRQLAGTGVLGVVLVLVAMALREKDRQLNVEKQARIDDAAKFNQMSLSLQREIIEAVQQIKQIFEQAQKYDLERERFERRSRGDDG